MTWSRRCGANLHCTPSNFRVNLQILLSENIKTILVKPVFFFPMTFSFKENIVDCIEYTAGKQEV